MKKRINKIIGDYQNGTIDAQWAAQQLAPLHRSAGRNIQSIIEAFVNNDWNIKNCLKSVNGCYVAK